MSKRKQFSGELVIVCKFFCEHHRINGIIILSFSALGCNYMHESIKMIMNVILKCAIMGKLQNIECKNLT